MTFGRTGASPVGSTNNNKTKTTNMKTTWSNSGSIYRVRDASDLSQLLPSSIYEVNQNPMTGEIYLEKTQEKFTFNYKIYGIEQDFINRVVKTWNHVTDNLGVLLNGVKGTGKTVTAKLICDKLNLPVLLVNRAFGNSLGSFLDQLQQDVIVFFDEFEKHYNYDEDKDDNNSSILSIMDGVSNKQFKKLFLLTTNTTSIEPNLLQRPSRIRYLKQFGDLPVSTIVEIVDDTLIHKDLRTVTVQYIATLNIITVDLVKSVVQEVNIHKEAPDSFKGIFNATQKEERYDIYWLEKPQTEEEIQSGKQNPILEYVVINPVYITNKELSKEERLQDSQSLYAGGTNLGKIVDINDETGVITTQRLDSTKRRTDGTPLIEKLTFNYKIVHIANYHNNFKYYAF